MHKKKADQTASPKVMHSNNSSASAQRGRLLRHLQEAGAINTLEARRELSILMPAARIKELRDRGWDVRTHFISIADDAGCMHHRVGLYVLRSAADE